MLAAFLAVNVALSAALAKRASVAQLPYTGFLVEREGDNVEMVSAKGDTTQGTLRPETSFPLESETTVKKFSTERPTFAQDDLLATLQARQVEVKAQPLFESRPLVQTVLVSLVPTLLLVGLFLFGSRLLARRGGLSATAGLGRSRAVLPNLHGENWFPGNPRTPSEATRELVDSETKELVDACYRGAVRLLEKNRVRLDQLAAALLAEETLDEAAAYAAAGLPCSKPDLSNAPPQLTEEEGQRLDADTRRRATA